MGGNKLITVKEGQQPGQEPWGHTGALDVHI